MAKPGLSFYTNMPTPYQLDFFDALKIHFDLHVIYFTARESDRMWELETHGTGYRVTVLTSSSVAKLIQKWIPSFHHSARIDDVVDKDPAKFVIVNGTYWSPNVITAIRRSYSNKKWVAYWSEPVFPVSSKWKFALKKKMMSVVLHQTSCILAIGEKAATAFRQYGYKKNIYQVPYNINTTLFKKESLNPDKLAELKNNYRSKHQFVFLSSGSLIPRKGMDLLINAFLVAEKNVNISLIIIGDGPEKQNLVNLAKQNPGIIFLGFQQKDLVPYWFNIADAFVLASRYDGWGLVVNEALAAGKPVIATEATGAATDPIVKDASIIINAGDVNALASAMIGLASDEQLQKRMADKIPGAAEQLSSAFNAKKIYDICRNAE